MALYEVVFIIRQDLSPENIDNLVGKFSTIVTDKGDKIVSKEYWGLRYLAYKIKKNLRGHYVLLNIQADNQAIDELKRVMGFNEDVIRSNIFEVENSSKEPSSLMVCVNATDYKPGEEVKKSSKIDDIIDKIIINN